MGFVDISKFSCFILTPSQNDNLQLQVTIILNSNLQISSCWTDKLSLVYKK